MLPECDFGVCTKNYTQQNKCVDLFILLIPLTI